MVLPPTHIKASSFSILAAMVLAILVIVLVSCRNAPVSMQNEPGLIWEVWGLIQESYVDGDDLDLDEVVGGTISAMLESAGESSYPFLTALNKANGRIPKDVPEDFKDVWRAWIILRNEHPELNQQFLNGAAARGMVASLGDRSVQYLTEETYDRIQEADVEAYGGIGAFISILDGRIVLAPMDGSPALMAGINAGDAVVEVNGDSMEGLNADQVVQKVRGPSQSEVTLLIERAEDGAFREVTIIRSSIEVPTVDVNFLPGAIGYIYIDQFKERTPFEVLDVLERLQQAEMMALVLDLRLNREGSIASARDVASQFLHPGLFMYEVNKAGEHSDWNIEEEGIATEELPMVVLVNNATANVAEVLAGALQDAGRAKVMGTPTEGAGSSTSYFSLSDGSAIRMPVTRWYTPLGQSIDKNGIVPDIHVSIASADQSVGRDSQLVQAYDYLNSILPLFR